MIRNIGVNPVSGHMWFQMRMDGWMPLSLILNQVEKAGSCSGGDWPEGLRISHG